MTPAVFGFLGDIEDRFDQLVHNCLLVAGGFLAGYVAGGVLAWAGNRYVLRRKGPDRRVPEQVSQLARIVGGLIGAVIVALLVFVGGLGGGPGRGSGDGSGNPDPNAPSDKSGQPKVEPPAKVEPNVTLPKTPDPKPADVIVPVVILGGEDVRDGRFYLVGDDRRPKTFDEFKEAVAARRAKEKGKLGLELSFPAKNVLPLEHRAVRQVVEWARDEARMKVGFAENP